MNRPPSHSPEAPWPLPVWSEPDTESEFPHGAFPPPSESGRVPRRAVLKGAGTLAALSALGACFRQPPREILPYSQRPEPVRPGVPLNFATCTNLGGYAVGLLVESSEGHPQKIEGNPEHPWSLGATGPFEQAELLQLYDPNRQRQFLHNESPSSRQAALERLQEIARAAEQNGGAGLRILAEPDSSPLIQALQARLLQRFPQAKLVHWAALSEEQTSAGSTLALGAPLTAVPDLRDADVILTLDADVLAIFPGNLRLARQIADRRVPEAKLNRLYAVETPLSVTGMFADHRLALAPSDLEAFAIALVHALVEAGGPGELAQLTADLPRPELDEPRRRFATALARDLLQHRGRSAVLCGPRPAPLVHAVAHALNAALGNVGRTIRFYQPVLPTANSDAAALRALVDEMGRGQVEALVITAWNPVYTAPGDVELGAMLARVPHSVYAALHPDQTSAGCSLVVPRAHFLEAWGDGRAPDGTVGIIQPLIQPLFEGLSEAEILAVLAGVQAPDIWTLLQDQWGDGFHEWTRLGLIPDRSEPPVEVTPRWSEIASALRAWRPKTGPSGEGGSLEVAFAPDLSVYDGRFAHNAWLQELPDPVTKIVWDNAAYLGARTAERLGVETGDVVRLKLGGRAVEAPVWIMPGHAEGAVTLPLGYGQPGGVVHHTDEAIGFNAYPLRTSTALWSSGGLQLERTGRKYLLVQTQQVPDMRGRKIALTRPIQKWSPEDDREMKALRRPIEQLYEPWNEVYAQAAHKWGMAIDLSRCTGCSACVLACQSENNISTVGKAQVGNNREMHWLRIDRYFLGEPERPVAVTQPLMCVHCEHAPCEYVCPVNATVHSDEGLNEQVYNRCIGTRYCSNNCPYKVRRFNYLDYHRHVDPLDTLYKNPDVTVRARGVMEKCTYCVQRIERARIHARSRGEPVRTAELQTACQQVCPTRAIIFGDLHDPNAPVTQLHEDARAYALLHDLGTRPRTHHLIRITHPNPELA